MNKRPGVAIAIVAVLATAGIVYATLSVREQQQNTNQMQAFFSVDDGATWFADTYDKPSGFLHDGKPAYAVNVYVRPPGKPFVGFLRKEGPAPTMPAATPTPAASVPGAKQTPPANSKVGAAMQIDRSKPTPAPAPSAPSAPAGMVAAGQSLVKKPGQAEWHPADSREGRAILAEFGPQAQSQGLEVVTP